MDALPPNAVTYLPVLVQEVRTHWPEFDFGYLIAGQVEQETCYNLKHKKCWNPRAELKTAREYGFGLGQLTITAKFNNFEEAKKLHGSLHDWDFSERYDPARQLRVMVLMDRNMYRAIKNADDEAERIAMMFSAYNGGLGGLNQDRKLCAGQDGCNPGLWFGHVENTSFKKKTKTQGYGKSFFEINREYVTNIMFKRSDKYLPGF